MDFIPIIDRDFIDDHTDYNQLIRQIKSGFCNPELLVPQRHHHDFPNPEVGTDSTLLLMPAWQPGKNAGVKVVTVNPENAQYNLPAIQGTYIYFDALTGKIKAILDAKTLTTKRTAATSALASTYLSKKSSTTLLMVGTGALSTELISAHTAVRPIKHVMVWGRDFNKATAIAQQFETASFEVVPIKTLEDYIGKADIISCATLATNPLIFGKHLRPGQFIDLVGAYKVNMREADDEAIVKSDVYLDTYQGGLKESGDIVIPINKGILKQEDIKADLFELCLNQKKGRQEDQQIILFKSVGHALEDLAAAEYYFDIHQAQNSIGV